MSEGRCRECGAPYYHLKTCSKHLTGVAMPVDAHAVWCQLDPDHDGPCTTSQPDEAENVVDKNRPNGPSLAAVEDAERLADRAIGKLKIPEWRAMVNEIAAALDARVADTWGEAGKIIDAAGDEWGNQARDRRSKTYAAYVVAALDLKGRIDVAIHEGKEVKTK